MIIWSARVVPGSAEWNSALERLTVAVVPGLVERCWIAAVEARNCEAVDRMRFAQMMAGTQPASPEVAARIFPVAGVRGSIWNPKA
jgi:hypothetical protein